MRPITPPLKRSRGQHLLHDANILKKIVHAAKLTSHDTVVEIGAGTGNLTVLLGHEAQRVVAIEIDNDLFPLLRQRCASYENIELVHGDARTFTPSVYNLASSAYLVVANIPYNITSLLIRKFLEDSVRPSRMILLIQREVARRICARPPLMNILALAVQYYATPHTLFPVSRNCFIPKPNVESAVIEIVVHPAVPEDEKMFFKLVKAGFSSKRKLLASNISDSFGISRARVLEAFASVRVLPTARAQELSLNQWKALGVSLSPLLHR